MLMLIMIMTEYNVVQLQFQSSTFSGTFDTAVCPGALTRTGFLFLATSVRCVRSTSGTSSWCPSNFSCAWRTRNV